MMHLRGLPRARFSLAWNRRLYLRRSFASVLPSLLDRVSVVCLPGLESVLSAELELLRIPHHKPSRERPERLFPKGLSIEHVSRCCLYLGTASQVRVQLASFSARGLAELNRKVATQVPWKEILCPETSSADNDVLTDDELQERLEIRVVASKSKLYHTGAIRERVRKGIQKSFEAYSSRTSTEVKDPSRVGRENDKEGPVKISIDVQVIKDRVEIFLNAFPTPLHRRGYRERVAKAPLREDIAYAMLFNAGWKPSFCQTENISEWKGLLDPFCGSGTIAIESAGMRLGLPPGRFFGTPFRGTVLEDHSVWKRLVSRSLKEARQTNTVCISVSDRDAGAVEATVANAKRAGVLDAISITRTSLSGQPWFEDGHTVPSSVLVVSNPPFGKRISAKNKTDEGLLNLYQSLGKCLQSLATTHRKVKGMILTDDPGLWSRTGLQLSIQTSFRTFHGGLKVSAMTVDPEKK